MPGCTVKHYVIYISDGPNVTFVTSADADVKADIVILTYADADADINNDIRVDAARNISLYYYY